MATYAGKTYSNGNVPKSILAPLDGSNYGNAELRRDAAESWNRARAEVQARTGIVLTVRGWNRTLAEQERFFFERYRKQATGGTDVRWYKGSRYVRFTGAPAAIPGTSNHGWGLAVDVNDFGAYGTSGNDRSRKATPILEKHGWTDDEGSSIGEPWHRVYKPERDTQKNAKPTTPTQEVPDMDATQAKQLSDIHAALPKLNDLFTGVSPKIDIVPDGSDKVTMRTAIKYLLAARSNAAAISRSVSAAVVKELPNVDQAAITKTVTAAVDKALADIQITLTKEN